MIEPWEWIQAAICGPLFLALIAAVFYTVLHISTREKGKPETRSGPVWHDGIVQPQIPVCIAGRDCTITAARGEPANSVINVGWVGSEPIQVDNWPVRKKVNH